jgi:hypothetical protein
VTVRRCLPDKLLLRFQLPPRLIEADFARDCLGKSRPANRLGEATSRRKQPFAGLLTKREVRPKPRCRAEHHVVPGANCHSITSSARASSNAGTSRPSAFAA